MPQDIIIKDPLSQYTAGVTSDRRLKVDSKVTINISTESAFDHGSNSSVGTSAVQITTTGYSAERGVLVKAANGNAGTVYIGNSDVTADATDATDGFELGAGESVVVPVDNVNKVYAIASQASQRVYWVVI